MKVKSYVTLLLLLAAIAAPFKARAEDQYLTREQLTEVEIATRVQSILMELETQADSQADKGELTDGELEKLLRATSEKILSTEFPAKTPLKFQERAKALLQKLSFSNLVASAKKLGGSAMNLGRRHGVAAGAGIVLGTAMDVVVPAVLAQVGLPFLIPISVVVPYQPILFGTIYAMQQRAVEGRLRALYPDPATYDAIKAARQKAREALGVRFGTDLVLPILKEAGGIQSAIVAADPGHFDHLLQKLGLAKERLTWSSLKKQLKAQNVNEPLVAALGKDKSIPSQIKAALLLNHLGRSGDAKTLLELRKHFSKSFTKLTAAPAQNEVIRWANRFARATTVEEAKALFNEVPDNVSPKLAARLWREVLLPSLAGRLSSAEFGKVARLQKELLPILAKADSSHASAMTPEWRAAFSNYFAGPNEAATKQCSPGLTRLASRILPQTGRAR